MDTTQEGEQLARATVREAMRGFRIRSGAKLAEEAEIKSPETVTDFLAGRRWPSTATLEKIEDALSIPHGMLEAQATEDDGYVERQARAASSSSAGAIAKASNTELLLELSRRLEQSQRD